MIYRCRTPISIAHYRVKTDTDGKGTYIDMKDNIECYKGWYLLITKRFYNILKYLREEYEEEPFNLPLLVEYSPIVIGLTYKQNEYQKENNLFTWTYKIANTTYLTQSKIYDIGLPEIKDIKRNVYVEFLKDSISKEYKKGIHKIPYWKYLNMNSPIIEPIKQPRKHDLMKHQIKEHNKRIVEIEFRRDEFAFQSINKYEKKDLKKNDSEKISFIIEDYNIDKLKDFISKNLSSSNNVTLHSIFRLHEIVTLNNHRDYKFCGIRDVDKIENNESNMQNINKLQIKLNKSSRKIIKRRNKIQSIKDKKQQQHIEHEKFIKQKKQIKIEKKNISRNLSEEKGNKTYLYDVENQKAIFTSDVQAKRWLENSSKYREIENRSGAKKINRKLYKKSKALDSGEFNYIPRKVRRGNKLRNIPGDSNCTIQIVKCKLKDDDVTRDRKISFKWGYETDNLKIIKIDYIKKKSKKLAVVSIRKIYEKELKSITDKDTIKQLSLDKLRYISMILNYNLYPVLKKIKVPYIEKSKFKKTSCFGSTYNIKEKKNELYYNKAIRMHCSNNQNKTI